MKIASNTKRLGSAISAFWMRIPITVVPGCFSKTHRRRAKCTSMKTLSPAATD